MLMPEPHACQTSVNVWIGSLTWLVSAGYLEVLANLHKKSQSDRTCRIFGTNRREFAASFFSFNIIKIHETELYSQNKPNVRCLHIQDILKLA